MDWSNTPSLAALRAFEAAARHGTLSRAADELNVTHAAIAQHVRGLENHFGETLLVRNGRGVATTDAGRELAEALNTGLSTIVAGVDALRERNATRPLQITVTPAFATHWLMPRVGDFWARYPDIPLNINPSVAVVDLRTEGVDLAVRYGLGDWPGLDAELLTDGNFWVVAHPDLVRGREITSVHDLIDLPFLLDNHLVERKLIIEREGIDMSRLNLTILMTKDLVLSAAVAGLGIAFQPRSIVEREIRTGQLVKVCELRRDNYGYHMVTVPGRETRNLRALKKWLRSMAKEADCDDTAL